MGTNGSLSFLFDRKGIFRISAENINLEEVELDLIDAGVEEIEEEDDFVTLTSAMENFGNLNKKLEDLKIEVASADLQRIPNDTKELDVESAQKVLKLIEALEDDDDVQNVYHNLEMTDELQEALESE